MRNKFKYPLDSVVKYISYAGGSPELVEGRIRQYRWTAMNMYDDDSEWLEYIIYNRNTKNNEPVPEERIKEVLK